MDLTQEELIEKTLRDLSTLQKKEKLSFKPPNVVFKNHKTTVFNFKSICKSFNRGSEEGIQHIKEFIEKESSFNSSINSEDNLIIVGRLRPVNIETYLQRYFEEFVTCKTCKSLVTNIAKEGRLYFICCKRCNEKNCVKNY